MAHLTGGNIPLGPHCAAGMAHLPHGTPVCASTQSAALQVTAAAAVASGIPSSAALNWPAWQPGCGVHPYSCCQHPASLEACGSGRRPVLQAGYYRQARVTPQVTVAARLAVAAAVAALTSCL